MPRYILFLEDLVRSTPNGHPDADALKEALDETRQVAEKINSAQRTVMNVIKLKELSNKFDGFSSEEIDQLGRLEYDGELGLVQSSTKRKSNAKNEKTRYCLLFGKAFLLARKNKKGRIKVLQNIPISQLSLNENIIDETTFTLARTGEDGKGKWMLDAGKKHVKHDWIHALRLLIVNNLPFDGFSSEPPSPRSGENSPRSSESSPRSSEDENSRSFRRVKSRRHIKVESIGFAVQRGVLKMQRSKGTSKRFCVLTAECFTVWKSEKAHDANEPSKREYDVKKLTYASIEKDADHGFSLSAGSHSSEFYGEQSVIAQWLDALAKISK